MMKKEFIAHRRKKDGETQPLWTHLTEVSNLGAQFAKKIGLEESGRLLGLLHDLGKASDEFDKYIRSGTGLINPDADDFVDSESMRGKVDHSSAGAQVVHRSHSQKGAEGKLVAQTLSLCLASHHSGVIDCLTPDGFDKYHGRMAKLENKAHTEEALSNLDDAERSTLDGLLSSTSLTDEVVQKLKSLKEVNDSKETLAFKQGLLLRFLFSCLIDADRLNTADFEFPNNISLRQYGEYHRWDVLIERLDKKLQDFSNTSRVDQIRSKLSRQCLEFAGNPRGLYQLTVPTGGGKTLASLRFALHHAKNQKPEMERVFYIIPYTSIIDQNADEVRKILEDRDENGKYLDKVVLEHHSNLTPEEETRRQNLMAENWDAPIVFTTQVQFLEALFSAGTRSARRMHQLANAVLIFDEVQTIPLRCVHMFNIAIRFLVNNCGATVVLCTATQPLLDKVEPPRRSLTILPDQKMMRDENQLFKDLKRVRVINKCKKGGWTADKVVELASKELAKSGSVLIVVNTKASAQLLHQQLKAEQPETFHLSTNMCPAHRLDVLNTIKSRLKNKQPVACVSTQLIEAGVDIDFGTVIRYLAGLDSIAQAAGRCNRNGLRETSSVFIVNPNEENIDRLEDIRFGAQIAERILGEFKDSPEQFDNDILSPAAMQQYYKYYFYDRKDKMDYPITSRSPIGRDDSLFSLLSTNTTSVQEYQRMNNNSIPSLPLKQSFQSAAKAFQAIDSTTRGVVVPYGNAGKEIINNLCSAFDLEKQFKLLKQAQRYSVNLYDRVFRELAEKTAIRPVQENTGIFYLDSQYYSNEIGLSKEIVNEMETFIIGR